MKKRLVIIVVILACLTGGAAIAYRMAQPSVTTEIMTPQRRLVIELVIASGRLRAVRQTELGAEVSGIIERVAVEEGDRVKKGQELVRLRDEDVRLQWERAKRVADSSRRELDRVKRGAYLEDLDRLEADVLRAMAARKQAANDYERATKMSNSGAVSPTELDNYRLALERATASERMVDADLRVARALPRLEDVRVAEAKVKQDEASAAVSEAELHKRVIAAPADGLIVRRRVETGQSVRSGDSLLTMAETASLEIYVETDENNLGKLKVGQPARVFPPAFADRPIDATVTQIGPSVDNQRGVVGVRLKPTGVPDYVLMDMTVDVNIEVARLPEAMSVPTAALHQDGRVAWVLTEENGKQVRRDVKVLGRSNEWAAIEGLSADARVVVERPQTGDTVPFRPM